MGQAEIQETALSCPTCKALGHDGLPLFPTPVRTLDHERRWLLDGSRMTRECHVRFCERLGVKFPGATLPTRAQKHARFHFQERVGRGLDRPLRSTAITAALSVKKGNLEQFHGVRLQIVMEMMGILVSENRL